jgi:hypothetical protein
MTNGHITCQMRSTRATQRDLERLGRDPRSAANMAATLDALQSVDALANLLDQALVHATNGAGRLDLKEAAAFILRRMGENQR